MTLFFLWFARNIWTDGDVIASTNFTLICMAIDVWIAAELLT